MAKLGLRVLCVSLGLIGGLGCGKRGGSGGDFEGEITMRIERQGGPPSEMIFATAGGRVRVDLTSPDGKHSRALIGPDGKAILVMDKERAWQEMDLSKAGAAVSGADPNGNPAVNRTGKHETVAGRDCEIWDIKHADGKRTESCITEGLAAFDFGALLPGAALLRPAGAVATTEEARQKKLFPLRSIEFDESGKELSRVIVIRIADMKLEPAKFDVPAKYKKIERP